jgi:micrococcal nuclease
MKKIILSGILLFFFALSLNALTIEGKVVKVSDGDTIEVSSRGYLYKIRLMGIDTPESSRNAKFKRDISKYYQNNEFNIFIKIPPSKLLDLGQEAKREMYRLVYGKIVKVEIEKVDRYGRGLGWVWLGDTLVNAYMVRKGLARPYMLSFSSKYYSLIKSAEAEAKANKRGIYAY